ncbi:MAG: ligase-associated DNA damage response endonuclease PdeM [Alphaproteobacteria bacterium]|nr:ligase-associated DNA damage response endonuclease PdeM [Alphaproteobacteria bacterium]
MTRTDITLAGLSVRLDPAGAAFLPDFGTLIVSDLHLEKASAFAARGQPLPPYDTEDTLARLEAVIEAHAPARLVSLGDSFHDGEAGARMAPSHLRRLRALTDRLATVWITGNHDPVPPASGGEVRAELPLGPLVLRHEPRPGALGEIAGHFHPCASLTLRGRRLRRKCFATDGSRLILPAFGAFTGGLDLGAPALATLFGPGLEAFLLGAGTLYRFPAGALDPSRLKA